MVLLGIINLVLFVMGLIFTEFVTNFVPNFIPDFFLTATGCFRLPGTVDKRYRRSPASG